MEGKCAAGRNCKFGHAHAGAGSPGKPDWAYIATIECALPRRQFGLCSRGTKCIYTCSLTDVHAALLAQLLSTQEDARAVHDLMYTVRVSYSKRRTVLGGLV
eukprot:CAMPEP_0184392828 /NCGR_PEP_ID=MMETSP0007-20130409/29997_1 /TAXON_ID=97485 /ORGANISM="Prymnesium parvum, Strain Texoma1" /LENGTH=101 /DNA_ID=CAMNT_0026743533 /DNA_START=42 /DNA_END=347 /DNA_ORIENTATION=-